MELDLICMRHGQLALGIRKRGAALQDQQSDT